MITFKDTLDVWFKPREIIIRDQDKGHLRYIQFKPWLQMLIASLAVFFVLFMLAVWGYSYWQHRTLLAHNNSIEKALNYQFLQIQDARLAYQDLLIDMRDHQTNLNQKLESNLSQLTVLDEDDTLISLEQTMAAFIQRLEIDLDEDDALVNQIINSRDILYGKVSALKNDLDLERQTIEQISLAMQDLDNLVGKVDALNNEPSNNSAEKKLMLHGVTQQVNRVSSLYDFQHTLTKTLSDYLQLKIDSKESILKRTGQDLETMLSLTDFKVGVGGDNHNLPELSGMANTLVNDQQNINIMLSRMAALDELLSCLPLHSPVDYYHVSSLFGMRKDPITKKQRQHNGLDMAGWPGTAIYAAAQGKIIKADEHSAYGKYVEIDHGCGVRSRYGHLKSINVKRGDIIDYRNIIGTLGSTGRSTGPHLHFEIIINNKHVNPKPFIEAGKYVYKS